MVVPSPPTRQFKGVFFPSGRSVSRSSEIKEFREWYRSHHDPNKLPLPYRTLSKHYIPYNHQDEDEAVARYLRNGYRYPGYPKSNF